MTMRELWDYVVENHAEDYALHDIEYGFIEISDLSIDEITETVKM
jgi:hypothetical protein